MPMPTYISVIAPLAGTKTFWDDLDAGRTGGEPAVARSRRRDDRLFASGRRHGGASSISSNGCSAGRGWSSDRFGIVIKTIRRILRSGTLNPIRWYFIAAANFHCFLWSRARNDRAAAPIWPAATALDPQYFERPADLSDEDRARYFDPIALTDATGRASRLAQTVLCGMDRSDGVPRQRSKAGASTLDLTRAPVCAHRKSGRGLRRRRMGLSAERHAVEPWRHGAFASAWIDLIGNPW